MGLQQHIFAITLGLDNRINYLQTCQLYNVNRKDLKKPRRSKLVFKLYLYSVFTDKNIRRNAKQELCIHSMQRVATDLDGFVSTER